ncbi:o-succinylbenzoate synthase [Brevibacillus choshinensis]|uniref:o-succinylbenzoate synthase n=1 Tax=Brevibacillus choshinensis TaxID=54911 RepID=UPI002E22A8C5|nr:o-succinylbenzoate synthase [Brevibacillus choshinensis]MED4586544.1 o-succinylbenzoate synthase [Brevibacillus choshinensis]
MKIEKVEIKRLHLPLKEAFVASIGQQTKRDFLLVSVHSEGEIGYGESVAMPTPFYNEETTETVLYMLETFLIPILLNNPIESPEDVARLFAPIRRNQMAKAALEGAVWDLYAKQKGISLAHALGGTRKEIEVGVSVGIEKSVEEVVHKVEGFVADGYKKIKVKIKPGFDIALIEGLRKRFGDSLPLMADANSAYSLDQLDLIKELDNYNLIMIEQPLAHDDIVDHARLQQQMKTPICLDESIHTYEDARRAIELGSCKIINIKVGRVGGLTESKKLHDLCLAHDVPVWCGGMFESGVGRAHNIAITSLANFTIPGDTATSSRYWEQDIVTPGVEFAKPGILAVPEGPGIGYEINWDVVKSLQVMEKSYEQTNVTT